MSHRLTRLRFGLSITLIIAAGCTQQPMQVAEDDYVTVDTPLVIKFNDKSQIFIQNRWVDLFVEQGTLRNYFRKQHDRYLQACTDEGVDRIKGRKLKGMKEAKEYFPTQLVLEVQPRTKAGSISYVKRIAYDYGFNNVVVRPPEGQEQATSVQ